MKPLLDRNPQKHIFRSFSKVDKISKISWGAHYWKTELLKSCSKIHKKFWDIDPEVLIPKIQRLYAPDEARFSKFSEWKSFSFNSRKCHILHGRFLRNCRNFWRNEAENNFWRSKFTKTPLWIIFGSGQKIKNFVRSPFLKSWAFEKVA